MKAASKSRWNEAKCPEDHVRRTEEKVDGRNADIALPMKKEKKQKNIAEQR